MPANDEMRLAGAKTDERPAGAKTGLELTRGSSLLLLLRMMYSEMLDYAVYVPDEASPIILSKEQVVVLVERGCSEEPLSAIPSLAEKELFRPMPISDIDSPDNVHALMIERKGASVTPVSEAVYPPSTEFPVWWDAPVPFAMCTRSGLKLNRTAASTFGTDLERLSVAGIPDKDEFIVEIQGRGRSRTSFLVFRRLEPDVFTLEDCTGDMGEAKDISWWAAVGRAWTASLEEDGREWIRAESVPDDFQGRSWRCEWQGRFQGYLCVSGSDDAPKPKAKRTATSVKSQTKAKRHSRFNPSEKTVSGSRSDQADQQTHDGDDVLKAIGPQTMALIAPGQPRSGFPGEPRSSLADEPHNGLIQPDEPQLPLPGDMLM